MAKAKKAPKAKSWWVEVSVAVLAVAVTAGVIMRRSEAPPVESIEYKLRVHSNGVFGDGVPVLLRSCRTKHLAPDIASFSGEIGAACLRSGCTIYDETAGVVSTCDDILRLTTTRPGGEADLWLVPAGRWFVFPTGPLGRSVIVSRVQSPRGLGLPVVVETISNSPRVFHLHNFLSDAGSLFPILPTHANHRTHDFLSLHFVCVESDSLMATALANDDPILGLQPSTTGAEHQVSLNPMRTSDNAFDSSSPAARALKRRAMSLLGMEYDDEMTDGLQVGVSVRPCCRTRA